MTFIVFLFRVLLFPFYIAKTYGKVVMLTKKVEKLSQLHEHSQKMIHILTNKIDETQLPQSVFSYHKGIFSWDYSKIKKTIPKFLTLYRDSPFHTMEYDKKCERNVLNAYAVYYMLLLMKPKTIIESGVGTGFNTWLIRRTLPHSKIFAFEKNFDAVAYKDRDVEYYFYELTQYTHEKIKNKEQTLVILNDYHNQFDVLQAVYAQGFTYCVVEKNYPLYFGTYTTIKQILDSLYYPKERVMLDTIIDIYREFPPIVKEKVTTLDSFHTGIKSIWNCPTEKEVYSQFHDADPIFQQEYEGYEFPAYIKLRQPPS